MLVVDKSSLVDNNLSGYVVFPFSEDQINATFSLERDVEEVEEFDRLISNAEDFVDDFSAEKLYEIKHNASVELTDSAYEQESEYELGKADYDKLADDLELQEVNFYEDSIMLVFSSPECFPDMRIYCQVDEELEVEEVTMY